ncbi:MULTISPECIES: carboxymuconolactone decarboxylase family protein [unclassified Nocardioides]|uniref:carboxymuconolactone decarboxylase family protein n=1 Tax=unclassified Nocardioides TaxID=2615069 RepID=UPI000702A859|nr:MULTISPECIES: carboxymuconolactone decarboxylase family protein [unclassified Nocardioides]KRC58933.1 4-carboxymuconolactone decarboxylase [Nocardioides sp. Root79]KRC76746.1 4-carboxymuconolactone decarboxylase [Nocardioides sp. Root240]
MSGPLEDHGEPRIQPGGWRDVGPFVAGFARIAGRVQGTEPPAVFLTLGRHRRLFWGWLHFAGRLMPGGRLSRRESELVIVRVASRRGSSYELTQHRRLARRAGLAADEVAAIEAGETEGTFSARERLLLRATDELLATDDLGDPLWAELGEHFDDRERIEVLMLVGHYAMLATALHALRVRPDRPR